MLTPAPDRTAQSPDPYQGEGFCYSRDQVWRDGLVEVPLPSILRQGETTKTQTSLPLNVPEVPGFGREQFKHSIKIVAENIAFDDLCTAFRNKIHESLLTSGLYQTP